MAIQNQNGRRNADGFLNNVSVVDAQGKSHRISGKGIPLYADNRVHAALMQAQQDHAADETIVTEEGEYKTFNLVATVFVPKEGQDESPITL